jgi:hypothetical protein
MIVAARRPCRRISSASFDRIGPRLLLWGAVVAVVGALTWFLG